MPCYSPIQGWRSKHVNPTGKRSIVFNKSEGFEDLPIDVPCGQCIGCRLEYSRKWAIRCLHEAEMHEDNCFLTLTYSDEKLPEHGNLVKDHFQKFMMRLRKKYGKGIRYFACGEYGEENARPHYHACIFGLDFKDKELWTTQNDHKLYVSESLAKLWSDPKDKQPLGWCTIGEVNFDTAAYVARYCLKKRKGKDAKQYYEAVNTETGEFIEYQPEFCLMSRRPGIGKPWLEQFKTDVYPSDSVIIRGLEVKPPRYYDDLYEKDYPTKMEDVKAKRLQAAKKREDDNTLARLYTKGVVKKARIKQLQRRIE